MHAQFRSKIDSTKLSSPLIGSFLIELTLLNQVSLFLRNRNHHWKCREQTESFQTIIGRNILEICNVLIHTQLATIKMKLDI